MQCVFQELEINTTSSFELPCMEDEGESGNEQIIFYLETI